MKKIFALMISAAMTLTVMAQQTETYSGKLDMSVGGMWNYTTENSVSYTITSYVENGAEKLDVVVPTYTLKETAIGDINVGSYTIKGLEYDTEKGGFYHNYANDGLSLEFSSTSIKAGTYELSAGDNGNNIQDILVIKNAENNTVSIKNQFKVGRMPFQLISAFTYDAATAIGNVEENSSSRNVYDLNGKTVKNKAKGRVYVTEGRKIIY